MTINELESAIQQCEPWDNEQLLNLIQALAEQLKMMEAKNESLERSLVALLKGE